MFVMQTYDWIIEQNAPILVSHSEDIKQSTHYFGTKTG